MAACRLIRSSCPILFFSFMFVFLSFSGGGEGNAKPGRKKGNQRLLLQPTFVKRDLECRPTCFEDVFAYNIGGHGDKTSGVHRSAGVFPLSLSIGRPWNAKTTRLCG